MCRWKFATIFYMAQIIFCGPDVGALFYLFPISIRHLWLRVRAVLSFISGVINLYVNLFKFNIFTVLA